MQRKIYGKKIKWRFRHPATGKFVTTTIQQVDIEEFNRRLKSEEPMKRIKKKK